MSSATADTRSRILEAAWNLLIDRDGREVRMADVAAAAGLSRQAVYLHFGSRADLMIATARYGDEVRNLNDRLEHFRAATSGKERLETFVHFWGHYIGEIYPIARTLRAARDSDEAVAAAWNDRMASIRSGCRETIAALERDGMLAADWSVEVAVDLLWSLLSVGTWEDLTGPCDWSTGEYVEHMTTLAKRAFVRDERASSDAAPPS